MGINLGHIAIAYLTWNRLFFTHLSLESLLRTNGIWEIQLYIFDNNSVDGTYEFVKEKGLNIIKGSFPSSVSGLNKLIDLIKGENIRFIGKIDNDVYFHDNNWLVNLCGELDETVGTVWLREEQGKIFTHSLIPWDKVNGGLRFFRADLYEVQKEQGKYIEFEHLVAKIKKSNKSTAFGASIEVLDKKPEYQIITEYYISQGWARRKPWIKAS